MIPEAEDLSKMKSHYPEWRITKPLQTVFEEIVESYPAETVSVIRSWMTQES